MQIHVSKKCNMKFQVYSFNFTKDTILNKKVNKVNKWKKWCRFTFPKNAVWDFRYTVSISGNEAFPIKRWIKWKSDADSHSQRGQG